MPVIQRHLVVRAIMAFVVPDDLVKSVDERGTVTPVLQANCGFRDRGEISAPYLIIWGMHENPHCDHYYSILCSIGACKIVSGSICNDESVNTKVRAQLTMG